MVFGREDFGRGLGHEGRALVNGASAFIRGKLVHSFHHLRIQGEVGSLQPRRGLSPKPKHVGTLISHSQPPEL